MSRRKRSRKERKEKPPEINTKSSRWRLQPPTNPYQVPRWITEAFGYVLTLYRLSDSTLQIVLNQGDGHREVELERFRNEVADVLDMSEYDLIFEVSVQDGGTLGLIPSLIVGPVPSAFHPYWHALERLFPGWRPPTDEELETRWNYFAGQRQASCGMRTGCWGVGKTCLN